MVKPDVAGATRSSVAMTTAALWTVSCVWCLTQNSWAEQALPEGRSRSSLRNLVFCASDRLWTQVHSHSDAVDRTLHIRLISYYKTARHCTQKLFKMHFNNILILINRSVYATEGFLRGRNVIKRILGFCPVSFFGKKPTLVSYQKITPGEKPKAFIQQVCVFLISFLHSNVLCSTCCTLKPRNRFHGRPR
jgi:hypothetical protein